MNCVPYGEVSNNDLLSLCQYSGRLLSSGIASCPKETGFSDMGIVYYLCDSRKAHLESLFCYVSSAFS